jgi:hypothetical protein
MKKRCEELVELERTNSETFFLKLSGLVAYWPKSSVLPLCWFKLFVSIPTHIYVCN